MKGNVVLGVCLAVVLGTAGCQDQSNEPAAPAVGTDERELALGQVTLKRGQLTLPPSIEMSDRHFTDITSRAINPNDYECPASTPISDWWLENALAIIDESPANFNYLYNVVWADLLPTYEALYFLTDATPQVFGYNGEYTHIMQKTHRDTKRFWNIPSSDIQLLAMKGTMLLDVERVTAAYQHPGVPPFGGLSAAIARSVATNIKNIIQSSEVLNGGNHPLFSFNAYAITDDENVIPDKIVMGDGILEGYKVLGYGDVAPQAVYAHEFGHHIQYEKGYIDEPVPGPGPHSGAEETRYTELMADAFSAYYLTHKRGAAMNQKRVEQFLQVFFEIGDCGFTSGGHHGTPNQRMKAARFGFRVADEAQKQGHILTAEQFHARFLAAWPQLIAPDAS